LATAASGEFGHDVHPSVVARMNARPRTGRGDRLVRRARLVGRLEALDGTVRLVLVAAPVGYGKTTLVRQWCRTTRRGPVWLPVTRAHRDPHHLAKDLAAALLTLGPTHGILGALQADPGSFALEDAAERLASAVRISGRPVVLVLDDLHEARTTASLDLVVRLAAGLPEGSLIVATADRRPRLPLGGLVSGARYVEIGAQELEFTDDEIAELLDRAGLSLPEQASRELSSRTERWPAGLQLAVTVLERAPDPAASVSTLSGDHELFAEYIRTRVLSRLSVETVRFLLRTSVLGKLSGPLCDAALDAVGSAAWLAELTALGLPLVPLDDRGEWYRYRRLFAEMLRAELRRRETGEDAAMLLRAARWYEDHDLPEDAIDCALSAGDGDLTAQLLVSHTQDLNSRGEIGRARRWLELLDEGALERYPPLAPMATWIWALTGDAPHALAALRVAEVASFDGPLPDGSASLESAVMRARAALAPAGIDAMLVDARRAAELERPGSRWHTMASLLLGVAHRLTGATADAERCFELAARYGRRGEYPGAAFAVAEQALLAADLEDWPTAEACALEANDLVVSAGLQGYGPSVTAHLAGARVAVHHGDLVTARHHTEQAARLYADPSPDAFPWLAVQAAFELGRLFLALGEPEAAVLKLADARRRLMLLPDAGLLPAWVDALAGDVRRYVDTAVLTYTGLLTRAELRVLALLPTHLSLAQIGDELVISRNTVKSQVAAIYRKLDAANRGDAVRRARETGLLDIPAPRSTT
jgi:LuxR family transcriptional regulator, maltose regulon positive regulatory protein